MSLYAVNNVEADNNNFAPTILFNGFTVEVKFDEYKAYPLTHLKFVILPSKCAPEFILGSVSLPIVNASVEVAILTDEYTSFQVKNAVDEPFIYNFIEPAFLTIAK